MRKFTRPADAAKEQTGHGGRRPFQALTNVTTHLVERYLPDPYVLVLLLTLVIFAAGMLVEGQSPVEMTRYWGDGFWNFLQFAMQMILVLITGYALANTPIFRRLLQALASLAHTPGQAVVLVTLVSLSAAWINWGFGLVVGALFARQLARVVHGVNYPLLIASGYSGYLVWHGGISGAIPLFIATKGHVTADIIGVIPVSETVFASFNLLIVLAVFIVVPFINRMMIGRPEDAVIVDPTQLVEGTEKLSFPNQRPADRLENSVILAQLISLLGLLYISYYFLAQGGALNFNSLIFVFLVLGIMLHGRPSHFLYHVRESMKGASGIAIQFPFYAGIMGMMTGSGLAVTLSNWFISISNEFTFPLFTFLSAGIVNVFVPSGGGQWAVQGPIMLKAGAALGVDPARTAMAVAWGDAWTNMLQPFWALPALAIAGLSAKDIMGYCLIVLAGSGVVISLGLTMLP